MKEVRPWRVTRMIPLLVIVCLLGAPSEAQYSGGTGTPQDPYQIATADDLILLGETPGDYDKHFVLAADIDMDPNLPEGRVFDRALIAPDTDGTTQSFVGTAFSGVFDGNGHTISHLTVSGKHYLGLFGQVSSGDLRNLGLVDVNMMGSQFANGVPGSYNVGGLAGESRKNSIITACYSIGTVRGDGSVGGLVGANSSDCRVVDSYSVVQVSGGNGVGGLAGTNHGNISTSCANGMIAGTGCGIGGLVGQNHGESIIASSYSSATVAGFCEIGGLVGFNSGGIRSSYCTGTAGGGSSVGGLAGSNSGSIVASFWDMETSGLTSSDGGAGLTTAELQTAATFNDVGWGCDPAWVIDEGNDYPRLVWEGTPGEPIDTLLDEFLEGEGTEENPYVINTEEDINMAGLFPCEQDKDFRLGFLAGEGTQENPYVIYSSGELDLLRMCPYEQNAYFRLGFLSGEGTEENPYAIHTAGELGLLSRGSYELDKHFVLAADIDMDPNISEGRVFDRAVIAPDTNDTENGFQGTAFTGVFDGNDHAILNLTIKGNRYLGLFGALGEAAEVSNVRLDSICIEGAVYVGGLAGYNEGGQVYGCHTTGTITARGSVGGLTGENRSGKVESCSSNITLTGNYDTGGLVGTNRGIITASNSAGAVNGEDDSGGLVGYSYGIIAKSHSTAGVTGIKNVGGLAGNCGGQIHYSHSTGMVSGDQRVGGLVGSNGSTITASYSSGAATGASTVGGLVGYNRGHIAMSYSSGPSNIGGLIGQSNGGSVISSFWDSQVSGSYSAGGIGLTTVEMQDANSFLSAGWDFVDESTNGTCDYWEISAGDYPRLRYAQGDGPEMPEGAGTAEEPYLIRDAQGLGTVWFETGAHYRLETSVDLSEITWLLAVVPWFEGSFDGNGYVISNLHIEGSEYLGLFGKLVPGAEVSNVGLEETDVKGGYDYIGGLVGYNNGATIENCYAMGTVSGGRRVGGLVGLNDGHATIGDSYSRGAVSGGDSVGGLVGESGGLAVIVNSFSASAVEGRTYVGGLCGCGDSSVSTCSSTGVVSGDVLVGGLVGYMYYGSVSQSYSAGAVSGNMHIGGLVGYNSEYSIVLDSYSTAAVVGNTCVGGLVGTHDGDSLESPVINGCYSTGAVTGESSVGGFVGSYYRGTAAKNFWDTETSGLTSSPAAVGKTTAQMQTAGTFLDAGWDFVGETENGTEDIWAICEGREYPRLAWEFDIGDFDGDGDTDFSDFCILAGRWLGFDGSFWCGEGCDLTDDGRIDDRDLRAFAESWLAGVGL